RKHADTFTFPGFLRAAFVFGLVLGPILAIFGKWLAACYLGGVTVYAAIVLAVSLTIALRTRSPRMFLSLPLVFGTIHCGAGAGMLLELLRSRRVRSLLASSRTLDRLGRLEHAPQPTR